MAGGIFGLLGLIRDHRGAVEYDLRHRFGLGLRDVGDTIALSEMGRLVRILRSDPSSAIAAALEGWDFPISREALIFMDLFDVTVMANSDSKKGKPKPHGGRPYKIERANVQKFGDRAGRTDAEVKEILNSLGHNIPV